MNQFVTDTHPIVWYLVGSPKLSSSAKQIFEQADRGQCQIVVPTIVLVEIIYLAEKLRIAHQLVDTLLNLFLLAPLNYLVAALDLNVIAALRTVSPQLIPEMPDRIIVATAKSLNLPLISCDQLIVRSKVVPVIW